MMRAAEVWLSHCVTPNRAERFAWVQEIRVGGAWVACTPAEWRAAPDERRRVRWRPAGDRTIAEAAE